MQISLTMLSQTGGHGDSWEVCGAFLPGMMDPHPGRPDAIVDGPDAIPHLVEQALRMSEQARRISVAGLLSRNPGMSSKEARIRVLRRVLGADLYEAAYGRESE